MNFKAFLKIIWFDCANQANDQQKIAIWIDMW